MTLFLAELAELVDGKLIGDGSVEIHGAATLATARPGEISFLDDLEKRHLIARSAASALVVPLNFQPDGIPAIQTTDVQAIFSKIVLQFRPPRPKQKTGISPSAVISPSACLGDDVDVHSGAVVADDVEIGLGTTIHAGSVIMAGCKVGRYVTIFPNAVLYEDCVIGDRSIIHAGAVLGAYGFGYELDSGQHVRTPQLGYVEIQSDVEIGSGTTIDRGTYGPTVVGEGTKIDNLVMIAHNCRIGKHNLICSQVGIAGSTTTGDYVVMAGQVGVRDHVHIGSRAILGALAGVMNDIPEGETYVGLPATPIREQKLKQVALAKLPEMRKEMKILRKTVEKLEGYGKTEKPPAAA